MKVSQKTRSVGHLEVSTVFRIASDNHRSQHPGFYMVCGGTRADAVRIVNLETGKIDEWFDTIGIKVVEYPEASMVLEGK